MGWVHRRRDLGGVLFIHLRDREGVTQLVFHADADTTVHAKAALLASEYVIAAEGLLYCYTQEEGEIGLVEANPKEFKLISTSQIPETSMLRRMLPS